MQAGSVDRASVRKIMHDTDAWDQSENWKAPQENHEKTF
jgi:hypothetical protein